MSAPRPRRSPRPPVSSGGTSPRTRWQTAAAGAALLAASALAGCTPIYHDFVYEPNEVEGAAGAGDGLKIAVLSFADERASIDEGSHAWTWLPLVPYATEYQDHAQTAAERHGSAYFYPDLLPYTLALDLVANGVSRRVDIEPQVLDDYDLIVHGTIHSTRRGDRAYSYGLSLLGFVPQMVGGPAGAQIQDLAVTYRILDARGEVIDEHRFEDDRLGTYAQGARRGPDTQGISELTHQANREVLEWLLPKLARAPFVPRSEARDERIRLFHARLDPELAELVTERDAARLAGSGGNMARYAVALQDEIERRARFLEQYRRAEADILAKQQAYVYEAQYERLKQIGALRGARRETAARVARAQAEHDRAMKRAAASALTAGLVPLLQGVSAAGGGAPNAETIRASSLAFGDATRAMPDVPPPPDLRRELAQISIGTDGLASAGGALTDLEGNDVQQIRAAFLDRYRRTTRSTDEIRAFVLRQR